MENLNIYNLIQDEVYTDKEILNNLDNPSQKKLTQNIYMMSTVQSFLIKLLKLMIIIQQDQN